MVKEGVQTDGQRLLKQLREEYRRLERENAQLIRAEAESSDSESWLVSAQELIN
jgi:hypothetical protein